MMGKTWVLYKDKNTGKVNKNYFPSYKIRHVRINNI